MGDQPTREQIERIKNALASGSKIEALKIYRAATGNDLEDAKDFIETLIPKLKEQDPDRYAKISASGTGCLPATLLCVAIILGSVGWLIESYRMLALGVLVAVSYFFVKKNVRRAAEKVRIQKREKKQYGYKKQLIVFGDDAITVFEQLPEYIKTAGEHLNQAEFEFSEGAFAPFWDAIEKVAISLGHFDEGVQDIRNSSSQYTDVVKKYEGIPPQFPIALGSVEKLYVGMSTAERMKKIVHTAQCNFQFATIYEQRKTNQLLVAGFTNFAQALNRMTRQISDSIKNLAGSVDSMASTLNESMSAIHSRLGNMADTNIKQHSEIEILESARAKRERRALKMLDNI